MSPTPTESRWTLTNRRHHNRSTALARSAINYWGYVVQTDLYTTFIRCPVWSETSLGTQVQLLALSCADLILYFLPCRTIYWAVLLVNLVLFITRNFATQRKHWRGETIRGLSICSYHSEKKFCLQCPVTRLLSYRRILLGFTLSKCEIYRPSHITCRGFDPRWGRQHSFMEIDHEIFSTVILSLPLIQEGQLSVSGERMCTG